MQELIKEFSKPFYRLNAGGVEILPDSKEELRGISHREMFSFINDLLNVRVCQMKRKHVRHLAEVQVMFSRPSGDWRRKKGDIK